MQAHLVLAFVFLRSHLIAPALILCMCEQAFTGHLFQNKEAFFATSLQFSISCEWAHLFGVLREYLGGRATICELMKPARRMGWKKNGGKILQTSEPARRISSQMLLAFL